MLSDTAAALRYILQDDLYLLPGDKDFYANPPQEVPTEAVAVAIETPPLSFNCLGDNKKRLLVLVHYSGHEHMDPAHLKALESTLGRKELALADVAILNISRYAENNHSDFFAFYEPLKLLILGAKAIPAGYNAGELNKIAQVENLQQLYSYSFDEMLADREKVKAFWEQMKNF